MRARSFRRSLTALAATGALLLAAAPAQAAAGDVDATFGTAGVSTVPIAGASWNVPLVERPGGGFVIAWDGNPFSTFGVSGFDANGDPDNSYGTTAGTTSVMPPIDDVDLADSAIDSQGRVVVTGWTDEATDGMFVARFTANG